MIDFRTHVGRAALLSLLVVAGCGDEPCITQTTRYETSVSAVGYVGETLGLPIARFDLTQDFVSHTPYEACAQGPLLDVGAVNLTVTSTAATPLAIEFDVQGLNADSLPVWKQAAAIARIMPGETLNVGYVISSATHLNLGAKVILKSVAILP